MWLSVKDRLATLRELVELLRMNRRAWLIPMVVIWAAAAALLMVLHAVQYVAPFVYTIF